MILLSGLTGAIPVQGPAFLTDSEWLCVMCKDRWHRIASQESASGVEQGIDWTIPKKLLKQAAKRLLVASGLRMLCQGAIRRAGHGGDLLCPKCNAENTLRHVLRDCPRWAVFDLGPA